MGQLVIMHDLVGLFWEFKSKFVKRYCEAGQMIQSALTDYVNEVRDLKFPSEENFYAIKDEELENFLDREQVGSMTNKRIFFTGGGGFMGRRNHSPSEKIRITKLLPQSLENSIF